jgi:hypothetical protein
LVLCAPNGHPPINGYLPASNVVEHAQIVHDIAAISTELGDGDFDGAYNVWSKGMKSCKTTTKARTLAGFVDAKAVTDKLSKEAFFSSFTTLTGPTGNIKTPGTGRLGLQTNFWEKFITDALKKDGDFRTISDVMRKYAINKGVLGVATMYAAHEMESAISKATAGETTDDKAPHAWDEAVAFYYGDKDKGKNSAWEFTWKRDLDFAYNTAGGKTGAVEGSVLIMNYFREGLKASQAGNVAQMIDSRNNIYRLWALSAIRAALKYAFKTQEVKTSGSYHEAYHMEAYAYFLSAAGWVAQADQTAAKTVMGLLDYKLKSNDLNQDLYCAVEAALLPAYEKLGLDCTKVGTFKSLGGKTCTHGITCPAVQGTLPPGLSTYDTQSTITAGNNIDCAPSSSTGRSSTASSTTGTEANPAHKGSLWAAPMTLAVALAARMAFMSH